MLGRAKKCRPPGNPTIVDGAGKKKEIEAGSRRSRHRSKKLPSDYDTHTQLAGNALAKLAGGVASPRPAGATENGSQGTQDRVRRRAQRYPALPFRKGIVAGGA